MNLQLSTFNFQRFIALAFCLLLACSAPAAHAQGGVLLRAKPTTNNIAVNAISNYIAIELPMLGTNSTQLISIADLVTNTFAALGVGTGGGSGNGLVFSNVLTLNPTSSTPRLNGMHFTNQAASATAGYTIDVQPGVYHVPTNSFSMLRNGVNWNFRPGAVLISGTTGDESDYNIPFHDWSGAVTSYIWGAGTFIVSNNLANFLNLTNSASRVIFHGKEIRAANDQAAVMQGHPNDTVGGGSKLWLYLTDGLYSDGYDAFINQHNPNSAQTFIYASRLYGDNDDSGDSAFETTVGYANPGDCVIRVGAARGSVTLAKNIDLELGVLDLGAFNMVYSPTNDSGNGVLRNTYIYGTSNRTTSLIYSSDGRFGTAGTFVQCTLVGPTNRPIALITNDAVGKITFISSRFLDGFGATNSIRSVNAQRVTLVATDTPLGLHANVTASSVTNYPDARFKGLVTFDYGIDVNSDLNANGQLNAGDVTTTGTTILGGPLEVPTGAANGYVMTSDGSGVATWAAPVIVGLRIGTNSSPGTYTNLQFVTPANTVVSNAGNGTAAIHINASSSGGGGAGSLPANSGQFNTNTTLTIISGAVVTNLSARGLNIPQITTSRALIVNGSGDVTNSPGVTSTELEYLDGVTSAIQTQIAGKQNGQTNANQFGASTTITIASGALLTNVSARGVTIPTVTASRAAAINASGNITNSAGVDLTELEYLDGVTSAIQTQFAGKQNGQTNSSQFGASTTITLKDGLIVTNLQNVGTLSLTNGTGQALLSLPSYQGDAFAVARRTNAPATTGTTNFVEVAQGASADQVLAIHSVSAGQITWTNKTASGGTTAGPDGSQLISMDGETQWINGEDLFVQESFYSGQSNPWGQTRTTSGGSATFTGNPGYVRLSSWPTNTANYAAFHYGSGAGATVPWQSNLFIEAKLQILNSGDITNSEFSVGFYNAMQTMATTATVRWIGRGDWNPNWIAAVGVGSTYSYATTGLAIAHSTPYTLKIKGTTNSLAFYTNGVLFTTLTSNLPGGVAIQPGARSMATVNTGTVDDNSLDVDWLNIKVR